jgi:hypothetical protein
MIQFILSKNIELSDYLKRLLDKNNKQLIAEHIIMLF